MREIDTIKTLKLHQKIILESKFLNALYKDFYRQFKILAKGEPIVEIGSGPGFIKKIIPKAITTDVIKTKDIDKLAYAEKTSFKSGSVGSILMLNVFHHVKQPTKAIHEFERVLKKGGRIIMIEPTNTFWSRFLYTHFHSETFDTKSGWTIKGSGRMSDANGAIPWIIFIRDRSLFDKKFPNLKIKNIQYHSPFAYLISGGVSKFQPYNNFNYQKFKKFEAFIEKLNPLLAMFMTIVIEKK